jgi:hypothetical protein
MTAFEIIILVLIYFFCYGYALEILEMDNESIKDKIWRLTASFILAFFVPIIIGVRIANKSND